MYFSNYVDVAFPLLEEKEKFDNWFRNKTFTSVDDAISQIDSFIEDNGLDAIFQEDDFIKSVYQNRFGDSWQEEYEAR